MAAKKTTATSGKAEDTVKKTVRTKAASAGKTVRKEPSEKIYLQFAGRETDVSELTDKIRGLWKEAGHRVSSIRSLEIYVKPEENAAYYVINGKETGKTEL